MLFVQVFVTILSMSNKTETKKCSKCGETDLNKLVCRSGHKPRCKNCLKSKRKEYLERAKEKKEALGISDVESKQVCTGCKINKSIFSFAAREKKCYSCRRQQAKKNNFYREKKIVSVIKNRAKQKNIEFSLSYQDIVIPKTCPILGIELKHSDMNCSPSVDRINPASGYTKDNISIMSIRANRIKNDSKTWELLKIAAYMMMVTEKDKFLTEEEYNQAVEYINNLAEYLKNKNNPLSMS